MATSADSYFWEPIASLFDFTLKFEETIFSLVVSSLVVAASPTIIRHYFRQTIVARDGLLFWAKLVSQIALMSSPRDNPS